MVASEIEKQDDNNVARMERSEGEITDLQE